MPGLLVLLVIDEFNFIVTQRMPFEENYLTTFKNLRKIYKIQQILQVVMIPQIRKTPWQYAIIITPKGYQPSK